MSHDWLMAGMDLFQLLEAALIVSAVAVIQSAIGFGYALFATPLLMWIGMPLPSIIALVAMCSMVQAAVGAGELRSYVPWRISIVTVAVRMTGIAAGSLLLKKFTGIAPENVRALIGLILCLLVAAQVMVKPRPAHSRHPGWTAAAFISSGLLAGFCGMGGPPLVLWAMARNWESRVVRGYLFAVFALSVPFQLVVLFLTFGPSILHSAALLVFFLPLVYAGTKLGVYAGNGIEKDRLKRIAYLLLFAIGLGVLISGFMK